MRYRYDGAHQRALRISLDIRPEALALACGRSASMVLDYERGRAVPALDVAATIADQLGVPLPDLLHREEVADVVPA